MNEPWSKRRKYLYDIGVLIVVKWRGQDMCISVIKKWIAK